MVSGPDIVTYIGVPLAVLGVLPIIYNTISTLLTVAKVRRILRHGRLAGITRGDVINHVIEVELPRYTIAPLHRQNESKDYWRLCDYPSQIPGGTWTLFNWRTNTVGLKTQRIDYSDQLRQPQAEIEFEELVSFLLDLGAVPDAAGFRILRASGLWIPSGTPLLLSPDKHEKVLCIAPLDDSDGHLSLSIRWSSNWAMRDHNSLPPYWVLIRGVPSNRSIVGEEASLDEPTEVSEKSTVIRKKISTTSKYAPIPEGVMGAIRCQIGPNGLVSAVPDDLNAQLFDNLEISHLVADGSNPSGIWFASAITSLGTTCQTMLWNYRIPDSVLSFAKRGTVSCGILVLLGVVEDAATPEWATVYNDIEEERAATFRRMAEQSRTMIKENQLPPEQRAAAVRERQIKDHEDWADAHNTRQRRDRQREETRIVEAIQSPKWGNKLIAEHTLAYLKAHGKVEESLDSRRVVEILLWRMITDVQLAQDLGQMLNVWKAFDDNGGLRKSDYLALKENITMFAFASLVLAVIENSVLAAHGSLAMDLQECVRIWKKVRLG